MTDEEKRPDCRAFAMDFLGATENWPGARVTAAWASGFDDGIETTQETWRQTSLLRRLLYAWEGDLPRQVPQPASPF